MACAEYNLQENHHLQCSVCYLPYNTTNHKPKMMACGHSFCLECLAQIAESQDSISCPQDRRKYPIPHGSVDNFPNNFTILSFLADLCADCGVRPKQKLCLEEHCSKYLCDACRENHCQSFHSDLRAALTELKQEASLNDDDDDDIEQLEANAEHAVAEMTKLCEELKHNLIGVIKASKEKSIKLLFEWKERFVITKAQCRLKATKLLLFTSGAHQAQLPDDVMTDTHKQMIEVKTKLALKQHPKPKPVQFHYKDLKEEFDTFLRNLQQIIIPSAEIETDSSQRDITIGPISESSPTKLTVSKPDYTSATLQQTYCKEGSGVGEFCGPTGICVSPVTNLVSTVDHYNHRIHLLTDSLRHVSVFGEMGEGNNQYECPWDVTITDRGVMFITDQYNHRIQATDSSGAFLFTFGSEGSGQEQFQQPRGIASTHDHLYICDSGNNRVKVTTHDGTYVREFGTKGEESGQFHAPLYFIAVSEVHNKAVISDDVGNIYIFTLTGQFIRMIKSKQPPLSLDATGLAFDTHGNLIVGDLEGKQLVVLGEEYQLLATIGSGKLDSPRGVAVTPSGDIIVCDHVFDEDCVKLFKVPDVTQQ